MVLMLMGDEDRFDLSNIDLNGAKPGEDLPSGKTGVDQDPFSFSLPMTGVSDVGRISPASTSQQTNP
ncbi:MAG: hypothetical protein MPW15_28415 [Candidatus Manganitrophus sp.]|nr:hypothetical protein [Candidatus Manganitrophus sp.]